MCRIYAISDAFGGQSSFKATASSPVNADYSPISIKSDPGSIARDIFRIYEYLVATTRLASSLFFELLPVCDISFKVSVRGPRDAPRDRGVRGIPEDADNTYAAEAN